ncbi:MAG: transcriptional repressor [Anaerolineae bacterium]|nr:transcriptional repressor [Anaerolineae bacterium]
MNDPELRYQSMLTKLKNRGGRITSHRMALLRLIAVSEGHPNAAQLFEQLRQQFPTVSLATVYKTLALLKEENEVFEIDLRDDSHYDGNKPYPHPHLICRVCRQIIDGDEVSLLGALNQEIRERYQFQVQQSQLVFYGVCRDCRDIPG